MTLLGFFEEAAHRSGEQVLYLPVEVVVRLEPDGVEDRAAKESGATP
jgi:hypothetical protein